LAAKFRRPNGSSKMNSSPFHARANRLLRQLARRAPPKEIIVPVVLITAIALGAGGAFVWRLAAKRAAHSLDEARTRLANRDEIPFAHKIHSPHQTQAIQFIQNTKHTRAVVMFRDSFFAATDAGLVAFDADFKIKKHYTTLDGLPESDLTCLAVARDKLYIGTRANSLAAFDGERFEIYRWLDRQAGAVTALLESSGELLIGTFAGGLISFDGRRFQEIAAGAQRQRIKQIVFLRQENGQLYVGTFNDGLWRRDAGAWRHFTTADGLTSNRIIGIARRGADIFAATDFGLARIGAKNSNETSAERFQPIAALASLSGIAELAGDIFICQDNGALFVLTNETNNRAALREMNSPPAPTFSDCRLMIAGDVLLLVSNRGIHRIHVKQTAAQLAPFAFGDESGMPASNLISALTFDDERRLWVGNFRSGIDVFDADRRLAHIESDELREINALIADAKTHQVYAATAQGAWRFDRSLVLTRAAQLTAADGLLSSSVMHISLNGRTNDAKTTTEESAVFYATSRGVSFGAGRNLRGLTTVQGLPSNSAYTILQRGRGAFVGTLGGLAVIESGRVARVFRDDNSKLAPNWVTALAASGERIFVGTYGGGVFELTAAGELNSFASETGKQTVNPNAMWTDAARLYVGTLDGAFVFDLRAQRWTHLKDELPSPVVLSVTTDERAVYFGTTAGIARVEFAYFDEAQEEGKS
jgi:ligand-binding sensor domain-containing protein